MAGEGAKIRISAVARLEKYPVGADPEDIRAGRIQPEEVITSEDVLVDPDERKLNMLRDMGYDVPREAFDTARELREAREELERKTLESKEEIIDATD